MILVASSFDVPFASASAASARICVSFMRDIRFETPPHPKKTPFLAAALFTRAHKSKDDDVSSSSSRLLFEFFFWRRRLTFFFVFLFFFVFCLVCQSRGVCVTQAEKRNDFE